MGTIVAQTEEIGLKMDGRSLSGYSVFKKLFLSNWPV